MKQSPKAWTCIFCNHQIEKTMLDVKTAVCRCPPGTARWCVMPRRRGDKHKVA